MQHRIDKLLLDIKFSCKEIGHFLDGVTKDEYLEKRMLQLALEREFEIIGEALQRLDRIDHENLFRKIPEFSRIIGFRNVIAHGYDIIDSDLIWDYATRNIPALKKKIEQY